jgi:hypothetical protein
MPSVTIQKLVFIVFVVLFSATALGKSPFAGFPGGPSLLMHSAAEPRSSIQYGWVPPKRKIEDQALYADGVPFYDASAITTMHFAWDVDVDY